MKEYNGYEITAHKDGTFSTECLYAKANGKHPCKRITAKTLEEVTGQIDTFVADCQQQDREFRGKLETLTKQIIETARQIDAGIKSVREKAIGTLNDAVNCGKLLIQIKEMLPHGKWGEWQQEHKDVLSERTIQRYTQLAKKLRNSPHVAEVKSLRQAYLLTGVITEPAKQQKTSASSPVASAATGAAADTVPAYVSSPMGATPVNPAPETDVISELPLADLVEAVIERVEMDWQTSHRIGEDGSEILKQLSPLVNWIQQKAEQGKKMKHKGKARKLAKVEIDIANASLAQAA